MASITDFMAPQDPATLFQMLQQRFNGGPGNYGAPPSPGTLEQMQRALPPPMTPPTPPAGRGLLDMADMGAAAGGSGLPMPPQPQPAPQQQMPGFMQSSGFGPLDQMHQFIRSNQGALAGLGAALQTGRPVGYGTMQGAELDKKRKDEEEEKTREKNFADATSAFIKDPTFQAMVKADPRKASEMLRLYQADLRDQRDFKFQQEKFGYEKGRDSKTDARYAAADARDQALFDLKMKAANAPKTEEYDPKKVYFRNGERIDLGVSPDQREPPAGYERDPDRPGGLRPIAGGPADREKEIPADIAGRLAVSQQFLDNYKDKVGPDGKAIPGLGSRVAGGEVSGMIDAPLAQMDVGKRGEVLRQWRGGIEALARALTGAGMPASEVAERVRQYEPSVTDSATKAKEKLDFLKDALERFSNTAMQGRGRPGAAPSTKPTGKTSSGINWSVE